MNMPLVKSVQQENKFLISQPKHVLWVLKIMVSKHMLKLMGKKIFTILHSKSVFI